MPRGPSSPSPAGASVRPLLAAQGVYYVGTGAWAIVHRQSFEAVTGPKRDYWLVRTVGLLAVAIGTALLVSARAERPTPEAVTLAIGAGVSFTAVDVVAVARRRIGPIYLGDAAAHAALGALAFVAVRRRHQVVAASY